MNENQLIAYLRKVAISDYEVDLVVANICEYGSDSLALCHRSNCSTKILGYAEPSVVNRLCILLNSHISDEMPGGFNACPYFYSHLPVGNYK